MTTYTLSVTGGYNGGARVSLSRENTEIFYAIGNSPYNLAYTPNSGSVDGINIEIPNLSSSTSRLVINLTGAITDTLSISPQGANTSYGYNFMTTYEIEGRETYTITYNANGGSGTMSPQIVYRDEDVTLSLNAFTLTDHSFVGWATSSSGAVVYQNGDIVNNIAEPNTTITLYAKWESITGFTIKLQHTESPVNKLSKSITDIKTMEGVLRDVTSIIDPVIMIKCSMADVRNANYMYIAQFKRHYFITNIRSIRHNLVEITAHVDVLTTYKDDIRKNKAILRRSENNWNLYLNDGSLKIYQNPTVQTKAFPHGFSNYEFVLAVAGSAAD